MNLPVRLSAIFFVFVPFWLVACSGNSTSSSTANRPASFVDGYVGAANVRNAVIYAVPVNVQGQPSTEINQTNEEIYLGSVSSSSMVGLYRGRVASNDIGKPMVFIAQGKADNATLEVCELPANCAVDWTYAQTRPVADEFRLLSAVGNVQNNTRSNVNWITHLAADHAYTSYVDTTDDDIDNPSTPLDGMFTPFTIERGNIWLSRQFDLSDVVSVRPIAPSEMHKDLGLSSVLRAIGIRYGLLLAAGQQLAKDAGQTQVEWLRDVVSQQRSLGGQLYLNHDTEFSMRALYQAALDIATEHEGYLQSSGLVVPPQLSGVIETFQQRVDALSVLAVGTVSDISVSTAEIANWVDRLANAKIFLQDTNERLLNYKGQDPQTCPVWSDDPDRTCKNSFIDPAYVAKTTDYYDGVAALYRQVAPGLDLVLRELRDYSLALIGCLNDAPACAGDTRYNSTAKSYSIPGGITLTLKEVKLGLSSEEDDLYNAFDVQITGTQTVSYGAGNLSILYKQPTTTNASGAEVIQKARLRIVYNEAVAIPPLTAVDDGLGNIPADHVEPLGFDIEWPDVEISLPDQQKLNVYLGTKLIGVRDIFDDASRYHYNITELAFSLLMRGAVLGTVTEQGKAVELRNLAQMSLTAKPTNAPNYYSDSVWPELDDFFRVRPGYDLDQNVIQPDLFTYDLKQNEEIVLTINNSGVVTRTMADYFQIEIDRVGINRFELFADTAGTGKLLRKCSVPDEGTDDERERNKVCTSTQAVENTFSLLNDLIYGEKDYLGLFAIPGRGGYRLDLPADKEDFIPSDTVDGVLMAIFSQGLDSVQFRAAHELVNQSGAGVSRAPMAIVDMKLTSPSKDNWEVAIAAGYDYDYLVDVLPTGTRAQSLYLSYLVREVPGADDKRFFAELGGLIIFRGGVKLFTDNANGESLGMTLATRVDYELGGNSLPCGVVNRDEAIREGNCNAVGYLTFRNSLVAVIREERPGVYVARFSDGTFFVLGG